ncbi:MAG: PIN domain-containing protein [Candidatus Fimenecus sp.]
MQIYLVDYENVGVDGFNGLSKLNANAKLVIFYSENKDKITFGLHKRLCESSADISYMRADISAGKNALDFQLAFYAGVLSEKYPECEIYIVSKDKGYDSLVKIAHKQNCVIKRVEDLTNFADKELEVPDLQSQIFNAIKDIELNGIDMDSVALSKEIFGFTCQYKMKNTINGHISKLIKNNDLHKEICKAIKPLLKDKK